MALKLRPSLFNSFIKFCFVVILSMTAVPGYAQSMAAGDLAFTGFNGDGDDDFSIVALRDIPANSTIYFTDKSWNGTAFGSSGDNITWRTGNSLITAGTVVTFNNLDSSDESVSTGTISAGNLSLTGTGAVLYAYTGDEYAPDTFLSALATTSDEYDGTDGTLSGTGLIQGDHAILLSNKIDGAAYAGGRSGNTPAGYRQLLNDIDANWYEEGGDGTDVLPFSTERFVMVDPPVIAFATTSLEVSEGDGTAAIDLKLVEATGGSVEANVVWMQSAGTAGSKDISFSGQTVQFSGSDVSGDTQRISIPLRDDDRFEGTERFVLRLQNTTAGAAIEPKELTVTITDNDAPQIVFNEINADPGDDANGDGVIDSDTDEFIELVNNSNQDIDISGWVYADSNSDRFTFPQGTVIGRGNAVVLFDNSGDVQPTGNFGGAYVFTDDELGLNQSPETLTLKDAEGNVVAAAIYNNDASGQSNNLNPEITGNTYADHSGMSGGALSSPGTRIDGTAFTARYAVGLRGGEGWRFIATPTRNTSFQDLFSPLWTQGVTGSDAPSAAATLYRWDGSGVGTFGAVSGMSNTMEPGRGYLLYVYEDDDLRSPGVQGGFPKVISTNEEENTATVEVTVNAADQNGNGVIDGDEGYNLLGNPFGTDISVDAVIDALAGVGASVGADDVNANVYVWESNPGSGNPSYVELSEGDGETIAPFQAFFVRYRTGGISDGSVTFSREELAANRNTEFYKNKAEDRSGFEIYLGDGRRFDTYKVQFREGGTTGEDRWDGYKMTSLDVSSINLFSRIGETTAIARNVLPELSDLEGELRIPLGYSLPRSGRYEFTWSGLENLAEQYEVYLLDNERGQRVNLRSRQDFPFDSITELEEEETGVQPPATPSAANAGNGSRFELLLVAGSSGQGEEGATRQAVTLSPNYPNPFQTQTNMDLELNEKMHVKVTIWNIVGQKITTLHDEVMESGSHPMRWNITSNMPSGIYICKVEAGGKVLTRKMTLVK